MEKPHHRPHAHTFPTPVGSLFCNAQDHHRQGLLPYARPATARFLLGCGKRGEKKSKHNLTPHKHTHTLSLFPLEQPPRARENGITTQFSYFVPLEGSKSQTCQKGTRAQKYSPHCICVCRCVCVCAILLPYWWRFFGVPAIFCVSAGGDFSCASVKGYIVTPRGRKRAHGTNTQNGSRLAWLVRFGCVFSSALI